jgi:hypothetical protein
VTALGGPLPTGPTDSTQVIESLAQDAGVGLVITDAGRYFGFVEGDVVPAVLAADWPTSAWDQNRALFRVVTRCRRDRAGMPQVAV